LGSPLFAGTGTASGAGALGFEHIGSDVERMTHASREVRELIEVGES
jgi:hypothetical protein